MTTAIVERAAARACRRMVPVAAVLAVFCGTITLAGDVLGFSVHDRWSAAFGFVSATIGFASAVRGAALGSRPTTVSEPVSAPESEMEHTDER